MIVQISIVCVIYSSSLGVHGARLFNSLPIQQRNENLGDFALFKNHLDIFLSMVPDQPTTPGLLRAAATDSLLDQVPYYLQNIDFTVVYFVYSKTFYFQQILLFRMQPSLKQQCYCKKGSNKNNPPGLGVEGHVILRKILIQVPFFAV